MGLEDRVSRLLGWEASQCKRKTSSGHLEIPRLVMA